MKWVKKIFFPFLSFIYNILKVHLQYYQGVKMQDPFIEKINVYEKEELFELEIIIHIREDIIKLKKQGSPLISYTLSQIKTYYKSEILHLQSAQGMIHRLEGENSKKVHEKIQNIHSLQQFSKSKTEVLMFEQENIIYTNEADNQPIFVNEERAKLNEGKSKVHLRKNSYLIEEDWAINQEKGGLTLISEKKKKKQGKIIKYAMKKIWANGSFMGISFPVLAMKPESILQTYAKSLGAAPILFNDCPKQPSERMKRFISFIFTVSRLTTDFDKPLNPALGQTFQAFIHEAHFYAQQISHNPPKSAILLEGQGYKIHGIVELVFNIGVNSADGYFFGDLHIEFDDGGTIFGRLPKGCMSGFVIGQNNFNPQGSFYCYDPKNTMIWTGKNSKSDVFVGYIGQLKEKPLKKFKETLKAQDRFKNFEAFQKKDYEMITHEVKAKWSRRIEFNGDVQFCFDDERFRPYLPVKPDEILNSDSRYRRDLPLMMEERLDEAQTEKDKIEQEQRYFSKLREQKK